MSYNLYFVHSVFIKFSKRKYDWPLWKLQAKYLFLSEYNTFAVTVWNIGKFSWKETLFNLEATQKKTFDVANNAFIS